jgi:hypothetical protein
VSLVQPEGDSDEEADPWRGANSDEDEKDDAADDADADVGGDIFMPPSEVEAQLRALWREEAAIVARIWGRKFGVYAQQQITSSGYVHKHTARPHAACRRSLCVRACVRACVMVPALAEPPADRRSSSFDRCSCHRTSSVRRSTALVAACSSTCRTCSTRRC